MPEKNQMFKGVLYIFAMQFRPRLMLIYVESCRAGVGGRVFPKARLEAASGHRQPPT